MKVIWKGLAPKDHPIYKSGVAVGGQRLNGSMPSAARSTAGDDKNKSKKPKQDQKDR